MVWQSGLLENTGTPFKHHHPACSCRGSQQLALEGEHVRNQDDTRPLCASAVAATSGPAAPCRPSICLAIFLNPSIPHSLSLSFSLSLSLSLSRSRCARVPVCGRAAGCTSSYDAWWKKTGNFHCQVCQSVRAQTGSLDHALSEQPSALESFSTREAAKNKIVGYDPFFRR